MTISTTNEPVSGGLKAESSFEVKVTADSYLKALILLKHRIERSIKAQAGAIDESDEQELCFAEEQRERERRARPVHQDSSVFRYPPTGSIGNPGLPRGGISIGRPCTGEPC